MLFSSLISSVISSQDNTTLITDSKSSQEYIYVEDLLIGEVHYLLSCKETETNGKTLYYFELKKDDSKESFTMIEIKPGENSRSIFQNALTSNLKKLGYKETDEDKEKIIIITKEFLANAYIGITVKSDSGYEVGVLNVYPWATLYKENKSKTETTTIKINKVEIKFEYEQITGIKVTGTESDQNKKKSGGDESFLDPKNKKIGSDESSIVVFQNRIPLSYSTRKDVSMDRLKQDSSRRRQRLYETKAQSHSWIYFDDVLMNDYRFMNQTEDYSPKDQIVTIKPGEKGRVILKEPITNILSANIYTDLVGLNSFKPNGLVQIEVSHRFYLSRRSFQFGNSYSYCGLFNSVRPKITFSKIESNNKVLDLKGDSLPLYANAIDIFKHTSWSSGGEVNVGYLGLPFIHTMIYINAGAYVLNVPMRIPKSDTSLAFHDIKPDENRNFNKGFLTVFPEIYWVISPHSRLQIGYSIRWNLLYNFSHDIVLVSDSEDFPNNILSGCNSRVTTFKFLASLRLNSKVNSEIFFRSYYNYLPNDKSQSYFQAQLGYEFNIFDRKIEPPPLKPFESF